MGAHAPGFHLRFLRVQVVVDLVWFPCLVVTVTRLTMEWA